MCLGDYVGKLRNEINDTKRYLFKFKAKTEDELNMAVVPIIKRTLPYISNEKLIGVREMVLQFEEPFLEQKKDLLEKIKLEYEKRGLIYE
jgi:hypothetical protein